jgi:hypothetical protein
MELRHEVDVLTLGRRPESWLLTPMLPNIPWTNMRSSKPKVTGSNPVGRAAADPAWEAEIPPHRRDSGISAIHLPGAQSRSTEVNETLFLRVFVPPSSRNQDLNAGCGSGGRGFESRRSPGADHAACLGPEHRFGRSRQQPTLTSQTLVPGAVLRLHGAATEKPPERSQRREDGALHDCRWFGQRGARIAQVPEGDSDLQ